MTELKFFSIDLLNSGTCFTSKCWYCNEKAIVTIQNANKAGITYCADCFQGLVSAVNKLQNKES